MTKNKDKWLMEITDIVCPKCEVYYLIRDMHKHSRAKKIRHKDGHVTKLNKIKKRDNLKCSECGIIRKYNGEKAVPHTRENYQEYLASHGDLQHKKFRRERKEKHLTRLHALKTLKRIAPYELIERELGKEFMILSIMKGINRIIYNIRVILLSHGADKSRINVPLLEFLMKGLKESV